jgi:hypothetical protein
MPKTGGPAAAGRVANRHAHGERDRVNAKLFGSEQEEQKGFVRLLEERPKHPGNPERKRFTQEASWPDMFCARRRLAHS